MFDGVFRQMVVRPLVLSGQSPPPGRRVGSGLAGSWPRFIGWFSGLPRGQGLGDRREGLVAEFFEEVVSSV